MKYRRLGRSGLQVSALALGTMNFGRPTALEEACRLVDAAIDAGINLVDCADVYNEGEAERILGKALQRNGHRGRILLTSKCFNRTGPGANDQGNTRYHIVQACERSLKQLRTDVIDIYFLHRTDFSVPQEESLGALDQLQREGKIRYIACSTHPAWRTAEALHLADRYGLPKFVCEQPPYNLLDRRIENEILPMCRAYDLGVLAWAPLAHGLLTGKYGQVETLPEGSRGTLRGVFRERITAAGAAAGQAFAAHAQTKGCTPAQLAVSWVLDRSGITSALIGPRDLAQLESLLPSVDVALDDADRDFCDRLVPPGRYVTSFFNTAAWMLSKGH